MSGSTRDLATADLWEASLARSRARRSSHPRCLALGDVARPSDSPAGLDRDLAELEPWELSLGRSLTRRRAAHLRFVPPASRARRVSLGALAALTAGPVAVLGDAAAAAASSSGPDPTTTDHQVVLTTGSRGAAVIELQRALGLPADGVYGRRTESAVRAFQTSHGLAVDNLVGPATRAALLGTRVPAGAGAPTSSATPSPAPGSGSGNAVARLQRALGVPADGTFGPQTETALRALQARRGLTVDGIAGPATWRALGLPAQGVIKPPAAALPQTPAGTTTGTTTATDPATAVVARVVAAADQIATLPYRYGGGHGSFTDTAYDCSGSVSFALHGGGLLSSPEDSTQLESYGQPGPGRHITIYANSGHAYMVVDGRRFDTSGQSSAGSRWSTSSRSGAGYVVRHPPGF